MDSLFRTRGSGVSSDVENTIVPQLLSEIDGVEALENVLVIGASNREDMIDPAILRPGRLDVKIKIERPDAESARDIFSKYLTADLPLHADDLAEFGGDRDACVAGMIQATVERMYTETEENRFLEVTYANGDKEVLYFKDFNSGAMIQNIVDRAKKMAIKDLLDHDQQRPPGRSTCSRRASTSSRRTRTCPTPPTPTTGRGSPARRASGSSSSARSSPASRAPSPAARSTRSPTPASTSEPLAGRRLDGDSRPLLATRRGSGRSTRLVERRERVSGRVAPVERQVSAARSTPGGRRGRRSPGADRAGDRHRRCAAP